MKALKYNGTDNLVLLGDEVIVRRAFRKQSSGVVNYVFDPSRPIIPNDENEYGFSIILTNGNEIWCGGCDPAVGLVKRKS